MAKENKVFELVGRVCPICGKEFFPGPEWVYKNIDGIFCSWHCLRANEKQVIEDFKKSKNQAVEQLSLDGKLVGTYASAVDAAKALAVPVDDIQCACYRNRKYKGYIWRYKKDEVSEM